MDLKDFLQGRDDPRDKMQSLKHYLKYGETGSLYKFKDPYNDPELKLINGVLAGNPEAIWEAREQGLISGTVYQWTGNEIITNIEARKLKSPQAQTLTERANNIIHDISTRQETPARNYHNEDREAERATKQKQLEMTKKMQTEWQKQWPKQWLEEWRKDWAIPAYHALGESEEFYVYSIGSIERIIFTKADNNKQNKYNIRSTTHKWTGIGNFEQNGTFISEYEYSNGLFRGNHNFIVIDKGERLEGTWNSKDGSSGELVWIRKKHTR